MTQQVVPEVSITFQDLPDYLYKIVLSFTVNGNLADQINITNNFGSSYILGSYTINGGAVRYFNQGDVIVLTGNYYTSFDNGVTVTAGTSTQYTITINTIVPTQPNQPTVTWTTTQNTAGVISAIGTLGNLPENTAGYFVSFAYTVTRGGSTFSYNGPTVTLIATPPQTIEVDSYIINIPTDVLIAGDKINYWLYYAVEVNGDYYLSQQCLSNSYIVQSPAPLTGGTFSAVFSQLNNLIAGS